MRKLHYSPDAREKLLWIKQDLAYRYGSEKAEQIISEMMKKYRQLELFANRGASVEELYGIPCDYRVIFANHNYAFYLVEDNEIYIVDIFHEKEDFIWKLFGIRTIYREHEGF